MLQAPSTAKRRRVDEAELKAQRQFCADVTAVLGEAEVARVDLDRLGKASAYNAQTAINIYYDGSYAQIVQSLAPKRPAKPAACLRKAPSWTERYIGSFGAEGWLTSAALGVRVEAGMEVFISRPTSATTNKINTVVRFATREGRELGRFPKDVATHMGVLMDAGIMSFRSHVIFAPSRVRTGENVVLQVRSYLRRGAVDATKTHASSDDLSPARGVFDTTRETQEEQRLRVQRLAILTLFKRMGLQPDVPCAASKGENDMTDVLHMAERDLHSFPGSEEGQEGEEGDGDHEGEVERDQLRALYSRVQKHDVSAPGLPAPSTMTLALRRYQEQALHWLVAREQLDARTEGRMMHPLWESYKFVPEDGEVRNDSNKLDGRSSHTSHEANPTEFYLNPYSGELKLDFPDGNKAMRGGILADEMGLGKTIEILSLIHHTLPPRAPSDVFGRRGSCRTTLIVAPVSLIGQWQSEAARSSEPGTLNVLLYHGTERASSNLKHACLSRSSSAPDIVITSYGSVLSEYLAYRQAPHAAHTGLFSLSFYRVVLDEAHCIKNRLSKTARACYALASERRWALTGTPIVNKLEDLFSLVHFLHVEPWGHYAFWRTFITIPFECRDIIRALDVVQSVLAPLALRRTKDLTDHDGNPIVELPTKTVRQEFVELTREERDIYSVVYARARLTYDKSAETGSIMKNYTKILTQLLRLRQVCCHPALVRVAVPGDALEDTGTESDLIEEDSDLATLIDKFANEDNDEGSEMASKFGTHVMEQIVREAEAECPLCLEEITEGAVATCWHMACKHCFVEAIDYANSKGRVAQCPTCRQPISKQDIYDVVRESRVDEAGIAKQHVFLRRNQKQQSSKVSALLRHLRDLFRQDAQSKAVVFTQFTSFITLIERELTRQRIHHVRFDGSLTQQQRMAVLDEFRREGRQCVLLISLKAGGTGLNLTSASHVYLLDPWWSWSVEAQAIDRIHRLGQAKPVVVTRFIVRNSVEEKMLKVQERKNFIASSIGLSKDEQRQESLHDIQTLFERSD